MSKQATIEATALRKFRPLAVNLCHHREETRDENLLKWLRARDFNVEAAEEMLLKAMLYREANKVDEILAWKAPTEFQLDFPYDMDGEDYEGYPVFIIPLGRWDVRRAYEKGQKELVIKYIDQLLERALDKAKLKNSTEGGSKYLNQAVFIWDLDGLTMKQMASAGMVDFCLDLCKKLESNFPEIMKISVTVNAPVFFAWLFAIVKPTLSKRTLAKIHIHGRNGDKWKPFLHKHIPIDQLPAIYGGTRQVTKEFFEVPRTDCEEYDDDFDWENPDAGMIIVIVEPQDQLKLALDVTHPNSSIRCKKYCNSTLTPIL